MVNVTVRNVPDEVRDVLAQRAASVGQSLQEYLKALLTHAAARPEHHEVLDRIRARARSQALELTQQEIVGAVHDGRA